MQLQLARHLDRDGRIDGDGTDALVQFVRSCPEVAEDQGAEQTLDCAASAIRDAPNGEQPHPVHSP